ncbi:hypothetical protein [Streptomyces sp. NPDC058751]|uniref:hypothetical protein n=1 Tax=Streptomyces sp. NPDC058751 TaxID=3346623 RepID=UPI0036C9E331
MGPRVLSGVEPLRATTYATCAGALLLGVLAAVVNTLCATFFLGESFGRSQGAGALILLAGAALAVTQGRLPGRRAVSARPPAATTAAGRSDARGEAAG